jgi:hypothetical protein
MRMVKLNRRFVGLALTSKLVEGGYELIDDQDSFVVRRSISTEANLLVAFGPYESIAPSGVQVDVVLGLQYPALQQLWNRLIEHQPEQPMASWSVMSASASKWCPDAERSKWFYPNVRDVDHKVTTQVIVDAVRDRGLPCCAGLEHVSALPTAFVQNAEPQWSCDEAFLLPVALYMLGKTDEAKQKAETFLHLLETAPRKANPMYVEAYRRFVGNIGAAPHGMGGR